MHSIRGGALFSTGVTVMHQEKNDVKRECESQMVAMLAVGGLIGYAVASHQPELSSRSNAAETSPPQSWRSYRLRPNRPPQSA